MCRRGWDRLFRAAPGSPPARPPRLCSQTSRARSHGGQLPARLWHHLSPLCTRSPSLDPTKHRLKVLNKKLRLCFFLLRVPEQQRTAACPAGTSPRAPHLEIGELSGKHDPGCARRLRTLEFGTFAGPGIDPLVGLRSHCHSPRQFQKNSLYSSTQLDSSTEPVTPLQAVQAIHTGREGPAPPRR